jgi:hypothetical protein
MNEKPAKIARRKEWRFDLPLTAEVLGILPRGTKFRETAKIRNISSTGAYLYLLAPVIIGTKLTLVIFLPRQVTDGKQVRLRIDGITVRMEKPPKTARKQGVAVRFNKEYRFVPAPKRA